jgi:hypothetical protein
VNRKHLRPNAKHSKWATISLSAEDVAARDAALAKKALGLVMEDDDVSEEEVEKVTVD